MQYKSPKIAVDGVVIQDQQILLIKRKNPPFKGKWALPGGFVDYNERTKDAVVRELLEETGLKTKILDLIGVYSDPKRDPRGHVISIVYLMEVIDGELKGGDDAVDARFFNLNELPELAFDHDMIIEDAKKKVE